MVNITTRWNPTLAAREPFYRLFDFFSGEGNGEELTSRVWTPAVDIEETDSAYRIEAELPGLNKDDVQITMENNVLRIAGERKLEKDVRKDNFHRIERVYGTFQRSFALPQQVDSEHVQASFKDGILTVLVPKSAQARPRKIEIEAGA
jgi:HSP20 family protein